MYRHLDSSTTIQMNPVRKIQSFLFSQSVWSSFDRTVMGKTIWENLFAKYGLEKVSNWKRLLVLREKGLFLFTSVTDIKLTGKN